MALAMVYAKLSTRTTRKMVKLNDGKGAGQQATTVRPTIWHQLQMLRKANSLTQEEPRGGTSEGRRRHLTYPPIF